MCEREDKSYIDGKLAQQVCGHNMWTTSVKWQLKIVRCLRRSIS
jgi:hypothetical protein